MKSYDFPATFSGHVPPRQSKDIYVTPPLDGLKKYGGSISISGIFSDYWSDHGGTPFGLLLIYGTNDGSNWSYIGSVSGHDFTQSGYSLTMNPIPFFNKLKIVLQDNTYSTHYTWGVSVSGTIIASVYDFVADEQSVDDAKTAAQQARDAANNVNTIVNSTLTVSAGVVQDSSGTVLSAARAAQQLAQSANNKLDNVQNALTQIQNNQLTIQNINQYLPATLRRISGVNGATATSSGALQVVLDYSNATQYTYQIDDGAWSSWMPISNKVSIPIPRGVHTLTVRVANGPVGQPGPDSVASMQVIGL